MRLLPLLFSVVLATLLGCSSASQIASTITSAPTAAPTLRGTVHGGQQPIAGARIQLYTLGIGLDGHPATPLLTQPVFTDASGAFNITGLFTCANYGEIVYLTATGGNPGFTPGTLNPNQAAIAMVDACGAIGAQTFLSINELTTAATVVAFGQLFGRFPDIGYAWSNNALPYGQLLYYNQLVDHTNGTSPGSTFPTGRQFPFATLNAMANVIASCVNSAGGTAGDGSPCGTLFTLTTPPGGPAPTNTVDALVNLQRNPYLNVAQVFAQAPAAGPFQPAAAAAPANWYLRLSTGAPAAPRFTLCTTWGDSLTSGNEDGSGITLANTLATLPSCYRGNDQGVGGQQSVQIALRAGATNLSTATIAGGLIPTDGAVDIAFSTMAPVTSQGPGYFPTVISGVPGNVTFDSPRSATVFTRTTPGPSVPSPAGTPYQATLTTENSGFVVLWAGRNDGLATQSAILANLNAAVAALPSPSHFVILSIPNANDDGEYLGTYGYSLLTATNQAIAARWPDNYLDIRALVIAAYNPANPEDVLDQSHDVPPASMRAVDDFGTLATALDTTTCTIATVGGGIGPYLTFNVEQEKIRIRPSASDGSPQCIRGYAGTTPAPHAAGTPFTGTDYLHLSGTALSLIAHAVDTYIQSH